MIISRTPFRISFFGGGTDYPAWYRTHGGEVLATTIDKYCYLSCRYLPPFFEHRFRVVYSQIENCQNIDDISHQAVREVLRFLKFSRGIEVHHDGDLPARSGMGSSSSFTVGLLHALYGLKGYIPSKQQLAEESIHIEQDCLKESVGSQDQVATAYGGLNHIKFLPSGEFNVQPLTLPKDRIAEFNSYLMLFFTGIKRTASDIAKSYTLDMEKKEKQMCLLQDMVTEGMSILNSDRALVELGRLMHEGWQAKKNLSAKVSNPHVENIYEQALKAGALGGKLLGAGGGGFILLFVPPEHQQKVEERLGNLIHVPFKFEYRGSQIIFYDLEEDYSSLDRKRLLRPIDNFREHSDC